MMYSLIFNVILQYSIVVQDIQSAELAKHVPERAAVSSLVQSLFFVVKAKHQRILLVY